MAKCYNCPECQKPLKKTTDGYYCKSCKETFSKDYVENRRDYDDDY